MTITCKVCQREFQKLISNTHLKTHNLTSAEYKATYGKYSLVSDEYRQQRSIESQGSNNPNFGNKMSELSKQKIANLNKGKVPWNFNKKILDTSVYRQSAKLRELKYASGQLERKSNNILSKETKQIISVKVAEYAKNNKHEIQQRAQKANATKLRTGYYEKKRALTEIAFVEKCKLLGFSVKSIIDKIAKVECNVCGRCHVRSTASAIHKNMCVSCSHVGYSSYETELIDFLYSNTDYEILASDRSVLGNMELDVYIPGAKLAIEIDGLYWHSEEAGKSKDYHLVKTKRCAEKGITLIHIFEDEWVHKKEICKARITSKLQKNKPVYARKCSVQKIQNAQVCTFLEQHHIQGAGVKPQHSYGLFHLGNLVAVMTFNRLSIAKGSKNTPGHFELNRYASIGNVIGGASRLFRYFVNDVNPANVISYADLRWNTGALYSLLGFTHIKDTTPGYWYTRGTDRIHRFKLRKTKNDPVDQTEQELRRSQGYNRIWDCGHSKWQWTNVEKV